MVTHFIHSAGLIWTNLMEEAKPGDLAGLTQLHLSLAHPERTSRADRPDQQLVGPTVRLPGIAAIE